ncbi:MAG: MBL fold metallo-hydrolase [Gammaproteobacteria bacterium]|nr:MBL fold metallo-hydrolase [Gammaproteobacteria bacterium]
MRLTAAVALASLTLFACGPAKAPPIAGDPKLTKLSTRVYVLHGPNELPNKQNQGFMNNPGFVLTKKGVMVIDPGSSVQVGELVLKKIAEVTKDPVIAVFNTHIHGDHWLGNQAIKAAYPKAVIYAHPKMKTKTATDGAGWVTLLNTMTDGAVRGTRPVMPDVHIEHGETLVLNGTHFRVYHNGKAHTDGDLMIEVVEEKVMFLGDNALVDRIGRMDDGDFKGNVAALDMALQTGALHFVPGHGPSNGRVVAEGYRDYLKALHTEVKKYYDQGVSDFEMKPKVAAALARFRAWKDFEDQLGRHVSLAYLQVEADAF